ncbi:Pentatricopeptide repeat-containing protein [Acorus gramineus]|uniref:Pentatricopeptide repeat-containing protein n=1 Tax=Acorus gramineus TaxID=55184 RepID=A0AAV9AC74_ACOGR|nr:Pentatricopeptide repeat-containing protein [Acorus gramineus]
MKEALSLLIQECKSMRELKQIHSKIITTSPYMTHKDHHFLLSRLLFFCAFSRSGSLAYAVSLFRSFKDPNLFSYNTMIRSFSSIKERMVTSLNPFRLYKRMLASGIQPDNLTFPFLFKSCTIKHEPNTGKTIHTHVIKLGLDSDVFVCNTMIYMYSMCGLSDIALQVLNGMTQRNIVSWNSILIGYLRCGELDRALSMFCDMKERNTITWNSIITGLVQGGRPMESLKIFHEMQRSKDVEPDKVTIASVVSACSYLGALDQGRWVHGYLERQGLKADMVIQTALIDMYGKCGCLERAVEVFNEMPRKDVLAWTAMISAFADHGLTEDAFGLLGEMERQGTKPNHVTFVALLSACAHAVQVDSGRRCFDLMRRVYGIDPLVHHYACLVDLLGRAGLFEEAEELIKSMPMKPDEFVWGALPGSCRMHGNVELGEKIAGYLISLDPQNHAFYVVLSDIYAKAKQFEGVKRVRKLMCERGIQKTVPGCSLIEVDGQIHEFSVRGSAESVKEEIKWLLNILTIELKFAGYVPDINEEF